MLLLPLLTTGLFELLYKEEDAVASAPRGRAISLLSSLLSSLELSDTNVDEPQIRALLGTAQSSFLIALICSTSRRILASSSAN